MTRPIEAQIDLSALRHNYSVAKQHAATARAFAVIKANAYGHGLLRVASALSSADGYALLNIEDAQQLRDAGFHQPILLLEGPFDREELQLAAELGLWPVIHAEQQLQWLEQAYLPARMDVFLKLNTGMNRLGCALEQVEQWLLRLQACRNVGRVTLMTHFATADDERGVWQQLKRFELTTAHLGLPRSMANSATLLAYPECLGDWVRPGIMLYGSSPYAQRSALELGLRGVMTLRAAIIAEQILEIGDSVGYGAAFTADRPMRIGIVACGYADGYPRHAPSGTPVLIDGERSQLVGRVSMDMLAVDLTFLPAAGIGSWTTLWGGELSIDEVAKAAGTIGYELMCAIAQRVPIVSI